ncbi:hypothetical protein ABZ896_29165 [Streptomyces sp. NPDC047072]|uniref:hypothetical protein n=1 Tax=Streptomyces sp. NPDC047072 TaxID=3154809 RepID=UPI00340515D0
MRLTRPMLALTGAVAVVALAGCGSGGGTKAAVVPEAATGSLEHLAAEVKCTPNIQIDADELRQAVCKKGNGADGRFILATFATDRGQREWINGAKDYGGHFLVGRKWVAVGETTKTLDVLRKTLGGDLEEGVDHSKMGDMATATHSAH